MAPNLTCSERAPASVSSGLEPRLHQGSVVARIWMRRLFRYLSGFSVAFPRKTGVGLEVADRSNLYGGMAKDP